MNKPTIEYRGISKADDGSVIEVLATIFEPEPENGQRDWSCRVRCPFLFATDKRIAGVDAEQALVLADAFLRDLLEHRGVEIEDVQSIR